MRRWDWPDRFDRALRNTKPFRWGKHDCCTDTARIVAAVTGRNPMREFHGAYDDEDSAKVALKTIGKGSLYHTLRSKFGNPVPVAFAGRADIVYRVSDQGPTIGVCEGKKSSFIGDGPGNRVYYDTAECKCAFRVG